jgi:pimeloyl-ACP methyl ester carboxylesterase
MPLCQYKNLNVHYTETGSGRALVLLHGFLENLSMWDNYVSALSKRYRVVCIDLLGHGKSDCHGYVHTMEDMAEGVKAVLRHLNLRRYLMIGHSMGGYVALAYGDLYPDNLIGIGLFFSTPKDDNPERKELRLRAMDAAKAHPKTYVKSSIENLFWEESLTRYKAEVAMVITEALKTSTQGIVAALAGMRERPDREALMHFGPYKFLVVNGKRDAVLPIEQMQEVMAAPNVTHQLITENGHMGHIEDAEICLEMIQIFIKDTHGNLRNIPHR